MSQEIKVMKYLRRYCPLFLGALLVGCRLLGGEATNQDRYEINFPGIRLVDHKRWKSDTNPSWSPDGTRLAYSRADTFIPGGANPVTAEIYVFNVESSQSIQLTNNDVADIEPDWSPDGSRIVFVRKIDFPQSSEKDVLMTMASDGSDQQILLHCERECASPKWSPDGKTITFWMGGVWLLQPDGSGLYEIDTESIVLPPCSWYPDSKRIVCGGRDYIVELNLSNNQERVIVSGLPVWWPEPDWSPDGKSILFSADPDPDDSFINYTLYVVEAEGGTPNRLISENLRQDIFDAVWSPDGTKIAFAYGQAVINVTALYILDLEQYPEAAMLTPVP